MSRSSFPRARISSSDLDGTNAASVIGGRSNQSGVVTVQSQYANYTGTTDNVAVFLSEGSDIQFRSGRDQRGLGHRGPIQPVWRGDRAIPVRQLHRDHGQCRGLPFRGLGYPVPIWTGPTRPRSSGADPTSLAW